MRRVRHTALNLFGLHVADLVDQVRGVGEVLEAFGRDALEAHLQLEVRKDRDQVGVAGALAVAVDGALHVGRARLDRGQRVRDADSGIVVRMDSDDDVSPKRLDTSAVAAADLRRQARAVGVAERDVLCAGSNRRVADS